MDLTPHLALLQERNQAIIELIKGESVVLCLGDQNLLISHSFNPSHQALLKGLCSAEAEAVQLVKLHRPKFLVCHDKLLPGDGIELIKRCKASQPSLNTLLAVCQPGNFQLQLALAAGADAICAADRIGQGTVLQALQCLKQGSCYIDKGLRDRAAFEPNKLSPRELEVLQELHLGFDTKGIANRLGISPNTAKGYQKQLFQKLGVSRRMHAVLTGIQMGLLQAH